MEILKNKNILFADDDTQVCKIMSNVLEKNGYNVKTLMSGKQVLSELNNNPVYYDLILLDIGLEDFDGITLSELIKEDNQLKDIPLIFVSGKSDPDCKRKGFEAGCVDYITKPFDLLEITMRINLQLELSARRKEALDYAKQLEKAVVQRTNEIYQTKKALIMSLSTLAETRDPETGEHLIRTQLYSKLIAERMAEMTKYKGIVDQKFIDLMHDCSPLHDIGKVGIPDEILLKKGPLTQIEFKQMKEHTVIGQKALLSSSGVLKENDFLKFASEISVSHHERWLGDGYPYGLKGDDIPLNGRIMAIADVYDALISKRVYKEAWSFKQAKELIIFESGRMFDPDVVHAFIDCEDEFVDISRQFSGDIK